jgi:hypothetical protein
MSQPQSRNWILLRGLARGRGHWGSFVERMQKKYPHDKIELIDLPGNGERNDETSPASVKEFVEQIRSQSQFVKQNQKFNILSISLGGMITVEWMRQFPHEVNKAFIMCTSSAGFSPPKDRFMLHNYLSAAFVIGKKDPKEKEDIVLRMTVNSDTRRAEEFPRLVEYSQQYPLKSKNLLKQLFAASQYKFPKEAPGDITLLGSFGDKLVSPNCSVAIGKRWNLPVEMHPWSGHDLAIDDPNWVLERLL